MYLISVYFDEKANQILNRHIKKIANESGNTFMIEHNVPPHLTIAAIEARSDEELVQPFAAFAKEVKKGRIQFVSVGQLLPYVMYATPVLNTYLQELNLTVYDSYKDLDEVNVSKYYRPNQWLPHVTLGKTLSDEQMRDAFFAMQKSFVPFEACIHEIGLSRVNPYEDIMRFKLKD